MTEWWCTPTARSLLHLPKTELNAISTKWEEEADQGLEENSVEHPQTSAEGSTATTASQSVSLRKTCTSTTATTTAEPWMPTAEITSSGTMSCTWTSRTSTSSTAPVLPTPSSTKCTARLSPPLEGHSI